jgi:hypothetical protein
MVEIILKNIQELKDSVPSGEVFENLTVAVDGLRSECNTLGDFKEKVTAEMLVSDE